jgi:hypothetical protein
VANLVLDGADGILLASETFRGKYPALAVKTITDICRCGGRRMDRWDIRKTLSKFSFHTSSSLREPGHDPNTLMHRQAEEVFDCKGFYRASVGVPLNLNCSVPLG